MKGLASVNDQSFKNGFQVSPIYLGVNGGFRFILFLSLCTFFFTGQKVVFVITHFLTGLSVTRNSKFEGSFQWFTLYGIEVLSLK